MLSWSEGPALLGSSMDGFDASTFACGGSLFATTMSGSIQRLSDDDKSWEFLGQLAYSRFFHRMLLWNNSKLVIVGGASMTSGKVEAFELLPIGDMKTVAK